ncbi:PREDICTED: translation initiation factor IF-2-like [Chinchilla lanigera]|uniref:translation initiation factor IF-2-like n=1 Tax=Chinchilla lanigera TaxID=34839 RepID=UPI000696C456|nr:PREDICTED: translation initiation factor IF-2-like [Chinchilla lanigera]
MDVIRHTEQEEEALFSGESTISVGGGSDSCRAGRHPPKQAPASHLGKLLNQHHAVAGRKSWPQSASRALKKGLEGAPGPGSRVPGPSASWNPGYGSLRGGDQVKLRANDPNCRDRHPHPREPGQLRWRRAFKSRSKQVRSDRARSPRQAAPAENLKGTLFARGPGAAPAGARAERSPTPPFAALPERTRGWGRLGPLQNPGLRTAPEGRGKAGIERWPATPAPSSTPNPRTRLPDHPGFKGQKINTFLPRRLSSSSRGSEGAGAGPNFRGKFGARAAGQEPGTPAPTPPPQPGEHPYSPSLALQAARPTQGSGGSPEDSPRLGRKGVRPRARWRWRVEWSLRRGARTSDLQAAAPAVGRPQTVSDLRPSTLRLGEAWV